MEKIVPASDPHRAVRVRVGCSEPGRQVSFGISHLPRKAASFKVHFETLGNEFITDVRMTGSDVAYTKQPLSLITPIRNPGVTGLAVSSDVFSYGLIFDMSHFEDVVSLPEVQACSWEVIP